MKKSNYTYNKYKKYKKGGWKWPWEKSKKTQKKKSTKKNITPERQLQMWRNSPNMKQLLKEDDFERKAKKKLEELEKQTIPITYKNIDNDDDIFFTPNNEEIPLSRQLSNLSFKSATSQGENIEEEIPLSRQLSNLSFQSAISHSDYLEKENMQDVQDEFDINKTIWGLGLESRTIVMKLEGKLCEILPYSLQRLCGFTIYFIYEQGILKIYKLTDTDNVDIINSNTIMALLRTNYKKFNPLWYPASVVVQEFYDDMNVAFFGNKEGQGNIAGYSDTTIGIHTHVGIYNNTQFIIQTQEIKKDVIYTFILDLTKQLNNYDGSILKPDITISKCLAKDTNNNCIDSCEECRYIKY